MILTHTPSNGLDPLLIRLMNWLVSQGKRLTLISGLEQ